MKSLEYQKRIRCETKLQRTDKNSRLNRSLNGGKRMDEKEVKKNFYIGAMFRPDIKKNTELLERVAN